MFAHTRFLPLLFLTGLCIDSQNMAVTCHLTPRVLRPHALPSHGIYALANLPAYAYAPLYLHLKQTCASMALNFAPTYPVQTNNRTLLCTPLCDTKL